jgi:transposase
LADADASETGAKKKSVHAAEQDRPDVAAKRQAWFEQVASCQVVDLIFLDEFGANTKMHRTYGRGLPGERVVDKIPHGHYKSLSTIAALSVNGIIASTTFDGGTTAIKFVDFIRDHLVPILKPGQILILDNLQAHKDKRVDVLLEAAGCRVLRLPPYSPDYNPIENAISKTKTYLRKLGRRTVPELFLAIREALATITGDDARNFMTHCGYLATM